MNKYKNKPDKLYLLKITRIRAHMYLCEINASFRRV